MPDASTDRWMVLAALALTVTMWASAFVAIRYVGRSIAPGPLALARLCVGSLALGAVMLVRRERLPARAALLGTVLCGVLWFGIYNVALNSAERRLDAGTTSLLVNTGPIFLAIMAGLFLREGFPPRLFAGCVVAFGGAALIAVGVSGHGLHATWGPRSAWSLLWRIPPAPSRRSRRCATPRRSR